MQANQLLELLLGADLGCAAALLLTAVLGTGREPCVALAAHLLLAVVLLGEGGKGRLNNTTTKTEHKVKSGLLLDVVVAEGAAVLELLASEDETLLIRGDALLVLDLLLHVLDGVRRLHIEGDGLTREGLYKDLCSALNQTNKLVADRPDRVVFMQVSESESIRVSQKSKHPQQLISFNLSNPRGYHPKPEKPFM